LSTGSQRPDALKTDHLQADLKKRTVRGGVLTAGAQVVQLSLNMVSTVVVARLLTPADHGLVAMVYSLMGFIYMFSEGGLSVATVQRREIDDQQVSNLFWINVAIGVLLSLLMAALGPGLSWFYRDPRLVALALLAATTFFFVGLGVQHDALLRRQMRFVSMAARNVTSTVVTVVVAVTMAWMGAGYWALVVSPLAGTITQTTLSWLLAGWRPGRPRRGAGVRPMLEVGGNLTLAYAISYVARSMDAVLIGRYLGAGPLGLYSKAYNLLLFPLTQLNNPLVVVALPALSRVQDDPERHARYYLRMANLITWVMAPLMGYLFVAAHPVVNLLLGDQWGESASVFRLFAVAAPAFPLLRLNGLLFQSRGRTDRQRKLEMLQSPVLVGCFVLGLSFGIRGVALAYTLAILAMLPWSLSFAFSGTRLTMRRVGRAVLYPVSLTFVAVVSATLVLSSVPPLSDLPGAAVIAAVFGAVYLCAALLPPVRDELSSLRDLLEELRPSRRSTTSPAA
jgi:O-antigen/teichoic acid export membrane protein